MIRRFLTAAVAVVASLGAMAPAKAQTSAEWRAAQAAYLAENAKKPGWQATPEGLQYRAIKTADAKAAKPSPVSTVTVHYEGKLIDGKIFDSSYERKEPISFGLNQVIRGWTIGVPLMRVGEIYEFLIPAELGYGDRGAGADIPPGSALIFKVELLAIK